MNVEEVKAKIKEILDGDKSPSNTKTISARRVDEYGRHIPDSRTGIKLSNHKKWNRKKKVKKQ